MSKSYAKFKTTGYSDNPEYSKKHQKSRSSSKLKLKTLISNYDLEDVDEIIKESDFYKKEKKKSEHKQKQKIDVSNLDSDKYPTIYSYKNTYIKK